MHLIARAWEYLGLWVNLAAWCTANATSAHVFAAKYISIPTTDAYSQYSLISSPSKSAPTGAPVVEYVFHLHHSFCHFKNFLNQTRLSQRKFTWSCLFNLYSQNVSNLSFILKLKWVDVSLRTYAQDCDVCFEHSPLEPSKIVSSTYTPHIIPSVYLNFIHRMFPLSFILKLKWVDVSLRKYAQDCDVCFEHSPLEPSKIVSSTYTTQIIPSFINKQGAIFDCSNPRSSRPDLSFLKKFLALVLDHIVSSSALGPGLYQI